MIVLLCITDEIIGSSKECFKSQSALIVGLLGGGAVIAFSVANPSFILSLVGILLMIESARVEAVPIKRFKGRGAGFWGLIIAFLAIISAIVIIAEVELSRGYRWLPAPDFDTLVVLAIVSLLIAFIVGILSFKFRPSKFTVFMISILPVALYANAPAYILAAITMVIERKLRKQASLRGWFSYMSYLLAREGVIVVKESKDLKPLKLMGKTDNLSLANVLWAIAEIGFSVTVLFNEVKVMINDVARGRYSEIIITIGEWESSAPEVESELEEVAKSFERMFGGMERVKVKDAVRVLSFAAPSRAKLAVAVLSYTDSFVLLGDIFVNLWQPITEIKPLEFAAKLLCSATEAEKALSKLQEILEGAKREAFNEAYSFTPKGWIV